MSQKTLYIDAESILALLTHYSQGAVPFDAELRAAGVSAYLGRWIGLLVTSKQWDGLQVPQSEWIKPLHIRYEGKKVLTWSGEAGAPPMWSDDIEAPKLQ